MQAQILLLRWRARNELIGWCAEAEAEADALVGGSGNDSEMSDDDDDDDDGADEAADSAAAVQRAQAVAAAMRTEAKAGAGSRLTTGALLRPAFVIVSMVAWKLHALSSPCPPSGLKSLTLPVARALLGFPCAGALVACQVAHRHSIVVNMMPHAMTHAIRGRRHDRGGHGGAGHGALRRRGGGRRRAHLRQRQPRHGLLQARRLGRHPHHGSLVNGCAAICAL